MDILLSAFCSPSGEGAPAAEEWLVDRLNEVPVSSWPLAVWPGIVTLRRMLFLSGPREEGACSSVGFLSGSGIKTRGPVAPISWGGSVLVGVVEAGLPSMLPVIWARSCVFRHSFRSPWKDMLHTYLANWRASWTLEISIYLQFCRFWGFGQITQSGFFEGIETLSEAFGSQLVSFKAKIALGFSLPEFKHVLFGVSKACRTSNVSQTVFILTKST